MRLIILGLLAITFSLQAQESIDGAYPFQTDPAKEYSLYIPSSYESRTPNALMLGLHPFNTNRWDAQAWRDTLIVFAEENNLILVCPDGGADGQVDSPIDTAFTSNLLDSVGIWYNIDPDQKYVMGFSWGGKTTYTYGLRRADEFKGYMPVGAAVNINEVSSIIDNASEQAFYLIHGSNDSPGTRYTPLLQALEANGSCVESAFLPGVGHTIDFPNRNEILTEAYQWLVDQNCGTSSNSEILDEQTIFPNPFSNEINVLGHDKDEIEIIDLQGNRNNYPVINNKVRLEDLSSGTYFLMLNQGNKITFKKVIKI